jgi:hypothetical protein
MGRVEELARTYRRHVEAPWQRTLAGSQRVMLLVYEKELERTLRARVGEFEQATRQSDHEWKVVDCTRWFAAWMAGDDYRQAYFEDPRLLGMKLEAEFREEAARRLAAELEAARENTVVALLGVASLYGFLRVSELIRAVETSIRGRLLVFFPGTKNENNYRLLDARDGWNYLAQGITLHDGG